MFKDSRQPAIDDMLEECSPSTRDHARLGVGTWEGTDSSDETQILTLTREEAETTWYKTRVKKPLLGGIEWGSLSEELVESHGRLFNHDELAKASEGTSSCKEAIDSAIKRDPQGVLHALYKSLCDTQDRGGASQHPTIAEEIMKKMKEVVAAQRPSATKAPTDPPKPHRSGSWPSDSQLASAEPDIGLHQAQAQVTAATVYPPGQAGNASALLEKQSSFPLAEGGGRARVDSQGMKSNPQGLPKQGSFPVADGGGRARVDSQGAKCLPSLVQRQPSRAGADAAALPSPSSPLLNAPPDRRKPTVKKEEWEGVVVFLRTYFGMNAPKEVLRSLSNEMHLRSYPNSQQLSEALQATVKERRMTWFTFTQYLLRSKLTRSFVFKLAEHTGGSIPSEFKEVLKVNLGCSWCQLATEMGLRKGPIQAIQTKFSTDLMMQIHTFLEQYKFPSFGTDTARFLVEALERVSLSDVAADVKKDLERLPPVT